MGRFQFQADEEQHYDHAELREVGDLLALAADPAETPRADQRAGDQVAEHRAEPEALADDDGDQRRGEVEEGLGERAFEGHRSGIVIRPILGGCFHFLRRDVADVGCEGPAVAEGIADGEGGRDRAIALGSRKSAHDRASIRMAAALWRGGSWRDVADPAASA